MRKPTLACSGCGKPMWEGKGARTDGTQMCRECRRTQPRDVRVCVDCGDEYKWSKHTRCSPCRFRRAKDRAAEQGGFCVNCGRPATAGKICHTCWAAKTRAKSGRTYTVHAKTCDFCGGAFQSQTKATRFCSLTCAQRDGNGWSRSREIELRRSPERRARHWGGHVLPGSRWVAGPCIWCGAEFVAQQGARYCSDRCAKGASWKRRYDRRGEFKVSDRVRFGIHERDGWECQICGGPVPKDVHYLDDLAPTLDHIVPQSLQLIPDHSPKNLRLGHRACNVLRSNRLDYETASSL